MYIRDTIGFEKLPEGLREAALARLQYPDAPLKELGALLEHPVGEVRDQSQTQETERDGREVKGTVRRSM